MRVKATPLEDWYEELGPVIWWKFPVEEPPWLWTPLDDDWPGYHTHFTGFDVPDNPMEAPCSEKS